MALLTWQDTGLFTRIRQSKFAVLSFFLQYVKKAAVEAAFFMSLLMMEFRIWMPHPADLIRKKSDLSVGQFFRSCIASQ